jgi:predicted transposase/invertase (TIGR01784 family)
MLIERANQEVAALPLRKGIIGMVNTIISYKFTSLSRREIDAMLGTKFEETRVYQEAMEEGLKQCREQGLEQGREQERQVMALKLLRQGLAIEVAAQATGLTIPQIQALQP